MIRKPMLAIGVAAIFAMGAAQAQTYNAPTPKAKGSSSATTGAAPKNGAKPSRARAPSREDRRFVTEAIQGDMAEVRMGRLAEQKGQSEAVKQFGQTLVSDHSANMQKAQQLAQSMGITPPSQPSSKDQSLYDRLSKLSGAQFDREFARAMIQDHREDISEFVKQAKKSDPTGQFAQQTLPTLRKHLQLARQMMQQSPTTGSGGGNNSGSRNRNMNR